MVHIPENMDLFLDNTDITGISLHKWDMKNFYGSDPFHIGNTGRFSFFRLKPQLSFQENSYPSTSDGVPCPWHNHKPCALCIVFLQPIDLADQLKMYFRSTAL